MFFCLSGVEVRCLWEQERRWRGTKEGVGVSRYEEFLEGSELMPCPHFGSLVPGLFVSWGVSAGLGSVVLAGGDGLAVQAATGTSWGAMQLRTGYREGTVITNNHLLRLKKHVHE